MSAFGAWLIRSINRLVPPFQIHRDVHSAKLSIPRYQSWEYDEIRRIAPELGKDWDVAGKSLLDVGCGLGGKLLYYAETGARQVVGIDLRYPSTVAARSLAEERQQPSIRVVNSDGSRIPFPNDCFDAIISVNVFEHVDHLPETLVECKRVLRPGGRMVLHFPPFYSPWGAHVENWVNFPWPHVFFSDRSILDAVAAIDAEQRRHDEYIPSALFDWAHEERLPELNRTTVAQFQKMVRDAGLKVLKFDLLPVGRHYLTARGAIGRAAYRLLLMLNALPGLREMLTTKMVVILTK